MLERRILVSWEAFTFSLKQFWFIEHLIIKKKKKVQSLQIKPQSHYSDNQSPTSRSRQPSATISNQFPTKMLVLNRSPTVCRPIADCLPTGRRVVDNQIANYSPTDYRTYFTFWNLISNHLESNRRLVADCLARRDLHNLLNHPAFKRNSYIFTTIRGQFHEYMLEFLLKWGWYNWLCKSAPTTSRRPVADQLRTTLPLFLHHLHFSGSNVYSFCMAALFGCRWLLMLHRKPLADQNCSAIINNHLPTIENHPEKGWLSEVGERLSM